MRKDAWIFRALSRGTLLHAIAMLAAPAHGEEGKEPESAAAQAVRRYARERLLQQARDTVDPTRRTVGGLEVLKNSLLEKDKDKHISQLDPARWAKLIELLGPLEVEGQKGDGLIRQGAIFYRWMDGTTAEKPTLYFRDTSNRGLELTDSDGEPRRETNWTVDDRPVPAEVLIRWKLDVTRDPDTEGQILAGDMDALRTVKAPLADIALTRPDEFHFIICRTYIEMRQRQVAARVEAYKADLPSLGLVSAGSVRTREQRAGKLRDKVNRVLAIQRGVEQSLDRLALEERTLRREAGSLGDEIEEARRAFEEFSKQRDAARAAEEKAAAEQAAAEKKAEEEPGADAQGDNDKGEKAAEEKGDAGEDGDESAPDDVAGPGMDDEEDTPAVVEEMDATEKTLEHLRLREILDAQKLRLLYIAVRRAALRTTLLEQILIQVKEEAVAAEDSHDRFRIELASMRRESQMDRLAYESAGLTTKHEEALKEATEGPEEERPVWGAYDSALEALQVVNEATTAGVEMRRTLEVRTSPIDRSFEAQVAAGGVLEGSTSAADAYEEGCLPLEAGGTVDENDPLRRFRDCRAAALDAAYVRDAMGALDHRDWDADMTAVHYEAVDDRIVDLESAREIIEQAHSLQERYDEAHQAAVKALTQVQELSRKSSSRFGWPERLREVRREFLGPNEKAFRETMRAIAEEFDQVAADIALYRTFRERLLHLGTRSFRVRLQRKLDTERLGTAYGEAVASVRGAGRWLSFQGDEHLGSYVKRHWAMLLACLGVLLASLALVKYGRRNLDSALRGMARRAASLGAEPVTVGAEDAQARREIALSEAAVRAEEEAALREVSQEEAGKAQRMGEGGYSAESDA